MIIENGDEEDLEYNGESDNGSADREDVREDTESQGIRLLIRIYNINAYYVNVDTHMMMMRSFF